MTTVTNDARPRVYVSTYRKYNEGNLRGRWMHLHKFEDLESFLAACKELHSDESDPELMFQDWELVPSFFVGESHINPALFELMKEPEHIIKGVAALLERYPSIDLDGVKDYEELILNYTICGACYETFDDFVDECSELYFGDESENFWKYFDREKFKRDLEIEYDYDNDSGYVFA